MRRARFIYRELDAARKIITARKRHLNETNRIRAERHQPGQVLDLAYDEDLQILGHLEEAIRAIADEVREQIDNRPVLVHGIPRW